MARVKPVIHLGIDPSRWPEGAAETVRELAPGYEVAVTTDRPQIDALLDRIEITLGSFPFDLIQKAPRLRWYQQQGAGADWLVDHPEVRGHGFTLTSASGVHAVPMSEHMLGFLLAFARAFAPSIRRQKERVWEENRNHPVFELAGKRVLLVGVGAIGARFARLCEACEMHVVGVRRDPSQAVEGVAKMIGPASIRDELPRIDIVANTLPYTRETHHLIGRAEFDLLPDGAIVINVGRGGTIDEAAMIDALRSGRLAGAGLDVFETEPLPADSPLWDMENVILTPHFSGLTPRYNDRLFAIFVENLRAYLDGRPLRNVVNKEIGY